MLELRREINTLATAAWIFFTPLLTSTPGLLRAGEEPRFEFLGPGAIFFPGASGPPDGADVADVNGDAISDAVASFGGESPSLRTYLADSPLAFKESSSLKTSFAGRVLLVDLTGDALHDVSPHRVVTRRAVRLINAQSSSVLRFNRRPLARKSFKITFTAASPSEPAAAAGRRRIDGSAAPRCVPVESMVLLHRIAATNDGPQTIWCRHGSPSWSTSSKDDTPSFGRRCTSAWVIYTSVGILARHSRRRQPST